MTTQNPEKRPVDLFEDTYCHQCRNRGSCEPVAHKDAQREVTVKVLCQKCRLDAATTQTVDELLSNVKRWLFQLRRSKKPWNEKSVSCSAYLEEILQLVTDTYVPEPQRGTIQEIMTLCDEITSFI